MITTINLNNARNFIKAELHMSIVSSLKYDLANDEPAFKKEITLALMNKYNTVDWRVAYKAAVVYHEAEAEKLRETGPSFPLDTDLLYDAAQEYEVGPLDNIDELEIEIGLKVINE